MSSKAKLTWKGDFAFEAELQGHKFMIDMAEERGGKDLGPRPMSLVLPALASCSAVGVVGILKKMRVKNYSLQIEVEANTTDVHPKVYDKIVVYYNFNGDSLDGSKLQKAVSVSEERYCGVYAMLSKTSTIESIIKINGVTFNE